MNMASVLKGPEEDDYLIDFLASRIKICDECISLGKGVLGTQARVGGG